MALCAGVVVALALQQVDGTPDAEACAESYNEGLKNGNCTVEKSHIVISLPFKAKNSVSCPSLRNVLRT